MNTLIIGCGYVGKALAKALHALGHSVTATVKTSRNTASLDPYCQRVFFLRGSDQESMQKLIDANDLIIVTLAAKRKEDYQSAYLGAASTLLSCARNSPAKTLIYTSSTSVYGDHGGAWVDEKSVLQPSTENSSILVETEKTYTALEELGWNVTILRLAEIYGPGRSLQDKIKAMQGRILGGTGKAFSNMIHLEDIVGAVLYLHSHKITGIYNLADDEHPEKEVFYHDLARKYHLKGILFDPSLKGMRMDNKKVSNHKIKSTGYSLKRASRAL